MVRDKSSSSILLCDSIVVSGSIKCIIKQGVTDFGSEQLLDENDSAEEQLGSNI